MKNKYKDEYLFVIIGILIGVLATLFIINLNKDNVEVYEKKSLSTVVNKVKDAVVTIEDNNTSSGNGTGFIYKKDSKYGYILTNEHVIEGNEEVKVTLYDGKVATGTVLGNDEYLDIAVVRIDKKYVKKTVKLGSTEKINIGDTVFTIGTPVNTEYRNTVNSGILSGKNRIVETTVGEDEEWIMRLIQMDISINPGNSGGPLFNINGEVIGICILKLIDTKLENMAFAIPIEYAINHIDTFEKNKEIKYPTLGIITVDAEDTSTLLSYDIELSNDIYEGSVITEVKDNSAASNANLKKGDIIIKVNNDNIKNKEYLKYKLYEFKPNDTITITYIRNNKEHNTKVKLK